MRSWLSSSVSGRIVCLSLLVLFALICGVHLAGIHHDGDADALGPVGGPEVFSIILLLAVALAVARFSSGRTTSRGEPSPARSFPRTRRPRLALLPSMGVAPLRC